MAGNVQFFDRSDYVLKQMESNYKSAMATIAEILVESVQEKILFGYSDLHGNPPHTEIVDTGALFDSIKSKVERVSQNTITSVVSASAPYLEYVHNGTHKLKGRPFFTDGVLASQEKVEAALPGELTRGMHD